MNNKTYAPFVLYFTTDNSLFQVLAKLSIFLWFQWPLLLA